MSSSDPGMDTPVAPLPEPAPPAPAGRRRQGAASTAPPGVTKRGALRAGVGHALASWRVLLFVLLVQLLLGLTVVLPFWQAVSSTLDHHPHAAALAGSPAPYDRALGWRLDSTLASGGISFASTKTSSGG